MSASPQLDVERPLIRWHGGKFLLAPWIISHFPAHRVYVEPFGGAASVLLRKPRAYAEIYNDLDAELVTLFRVLRSPRAGELREALRLTPFARDEFVGAYARTDCPVEQSRRMIIRAFMGFGSTGALGRSTAFRANSNRSGTTPAHDWANYAPALGAIIDRLSGVTIENRPAMDVMAQHDGPETLHYVDPPYVHDTRSKGNPYCAKHKYRHEMTDDDHAELLVFLRTLRGRVVLSGYPHPIYDDALADWRRIERQALADGARARTEVLWLNFDVGDDESQGEMPL
ncbi:MAG: DNA adenine methylase [Proteobacteria bacterium]|nr:DNA adenine methylase [Pseudomonadota bacterium]